MSLSVGMITTDSTDPLPLARWWADCLGGKVLDENEGWFVVVRVPGGVLGFQKVSDPTPGKNRMHIDFGTEDDLDAVAQRLLDAGATMVGEHRLGDLHWFTLADPQGNQFCVAPKE